MTARRLLLLALIALAALAAYAPGASAATSLVPTAEDVAGLAAAKGSVARERSALAASLPQGQRAQLGRARADAAAFRAGKTRLSVAAFVLASPARAKALVAAWRTRQKGARLAVGDGAARTVKATRRATTVTIVLAQGAGVGVVRYAIAGRDASAPAAAQAYAALLASRIAAGLAESPWDGLVSDALADGEVSKNEALRAFALAYGGLPGFPRTGGEREPAEGSLALRWIVRVLPELTPAQRAAVSKVIDEPLPEAAGKRSLQALTPDAVYQPIAEKFLQDYLPKIGYALPGGTLPFPIKVYRSTQNQWSKYGWAAADAAPVDATGKTVTSGAPVACRIRIFPIGLSSTAQFKLFAVAHEVFHCIQFAILGNSWPYTADWILEGTPDWAAAKILPGVPFEQAGDTYQTYLQTPTKSLFKRAYDAVGFLGAADAVTGDLWPKMRDIVTGSSASAFAAAGGQSRAFLEVWASYMLRLDPSQPAWYQPRPWSVSTGKVSTPKTPITGNATLQAPAYANRLGSVVVPAKKPFITIDVANGPGRLSDAQGDFVLDPGARNFCVRGACVCPPDEEGDFPPHEDVNNLFALALTGAESGSKLTISFKGIKEFCKKTDRPSRPRTPPSGGSNGDPHLTSLDGLRYDFQAAGEFVLVRSTSGDLEVQARQEPWKQSKWVTINTQFGFRVGGKKVSVAAGEPMAVEVAGKQLPVSTDVLVAGGSVSRDEDGNTTVTWPDGSTAYVWAVGSYGVAIRLALAESRAGKVRGLLGNLDGKVTNDLATRGGKPLAYEVEGSDSSIASGRVKNPDGKAFFDGLYDVVGESWRIEQQDSLLDYGPGQTTATFTNRAIPTRPIDQEALRAAARARAEQICRDAGVTDPVLLEDCILDVALTGEAAFAEAAVREQSLISVEWRKLGWGADVVGALALARTPDGALTLAADERPAAGAGRIASVTLAADGTEGAPALVSAFESTPTLAITPAGGLLALASLIDTTTSDDGVFQFPASSPFAAWGARQHVATGGFSYAGVPIAAFAPDGTQLTVSPTSGATAKVFRGVPTQPLTGVTPFSSPIDDIPACYSSSPGIAVDTSEVWLAWLQWNTNCAQRGLYVAKVDPAQVGTPAGIVATTRTLAPDSFWPGLTSSIDWPDLSLDDHVAIVSRPGQAGLFVGYRSFVGSRWRVLLWRIGTPTPIEVWSGKEQPGRISVAAEPTTGKLWIAWVDEDGRLDVRRTDAAVTGFETPVRNVKRADDAPAFGEWQVSAVDGGLDVLYQVDRAGDTPGGVWLARVAD